MPAVTESPQPPAPADDDLSLALALADAADAVSLPRFGALDLRVETKPDLTPVSDADTAVERAIADAAGAAPAATTPSSARSTARAATGPRRWIVDPIDGTKNFVRGVPVWATLIALDGGGRGLRSACVSAPALGRRWWAARGQGAWLSRSAASRGTCTCPGSPTLADASSSYSSLHGWRARARRRRRAAGAGRGRSGGPAGYGDFWQHALVAEGAVDAAAEPEVSLWDLAALAVLVEEAGGRFTDLARPPRPRRRSGPVQQRLLHEVVLRTLSGD